MVIGQIVVVAAAALALQMVLPAIWSGFQLVGSDPAPTSADGAANAAVLGVILLVLTTLVNLLDNRVMSLVNRIGVTAEIIGAVLIIVLLLTHSERSPGITFHTGEGSTGLFGALMVGSFTAAYVMIGFDSAGEMSEETHDPRRTAPRTILTALGAAGLLGGLIVLGGLLAAPEPHGRTPRRRGPELRADQQPRRRSRPRPARRRGGGHRGGDPGDPDGRLPHALLHGPRRPAPLLRPPGQGQPAHRYAERPRPGRRRPRRGPAAPQLRLPGGLPGHRHHLHRDAVPGVRDGHRTAAGTTAARTSSPARRHRRDGPPRSSPSAAGASRSTRSPSSTACS